MSEWGESPGHSDLSSDQVGKQGECTVIPETVLDATGHQQNVQDDESLAAALAASGIAVQGDVITVINPETDNNESDLEEDSFKSMEIFLKQYIIRKCHLIQQDIFMPTMKEMRHYIPQIFMYCSGYGGEGKFARRKVKGLWTEKPPDWPDDVPFCDPCNSRGGYGKPNKRTLIPMFDYLVKRYMEKAVLDIDLEEYSLGTIPSSPHSTTPETDFGKFLVSGSSTSSVPRRMQSTLLQQLASPTGLNSSSKSPSYIDLTAADSTSSSELIVSSCPSSPSAGVVPTSTAANTTQNTDTSTKSDKYQNDYKPHNTLPLTVTPVEQSCRVMSAWIPITPRNWRNFDLDSFMGKHLSSLSQTYEYEDELWPCVKELRTGVRMLVSYLFGFQDNPNKMKVKGMWSEKPYGWPNEVPYLDPCNSKDGMKPRKDVLMTMYSFLREVYKLHLNHYVEETTDLAEGELNEDAGTSGEKTVWDKAAEELSKTKDSSSLLKNLPSGKYARIFYKNFTYKSDKTSGCDEPDCPPLTPDLSNLQKKPVYEMPPLAANKNSNFAPTCRALLMSKLAKSFSQGSESSSQPSSSHAGTSEKPRSVKSSLTWCPPISSSDVTSSRPNSNSSVPDSMSTSCSVVSSSQSRSYFSMQPLVIPSSLSNSVAPPLHPLSYFSAQPIAVATSLSSSLKPILAQAVPLIPVQPIGISTSLSSSVVSSAQPLPLIPVQTIAGSTSSSSTAVPCQLQSYVSVSSSVSSPVISATRPVSYFSAVPVSTVVAPSRPLSSIAVQPNYLTSHAQLSAVNIKTEPTQEVMSPDQLPASSNTHTPDQIESPLSQVSGSSLQPIMVVPSDQLSAILSAKSACTTPVSFSQSLNQPRLPSSSTLKSILASHPASSKTPNSPSKDFSNPGAAILKRIEDKINYMQRRHLLNSDDVILLHDIKDCLKVMFSSTKTKIILHLVKAHSFECSLDIVTFLNHLPDSCRFKWKKKHKELRDSVLADQTECHSGTKQTKKPPFGGDGIDGDVVNAGTSEEHGKTNYICIEPIVEATDISGNQMEKVSESSTCTGSAVVNDDTNCASRSSSEYMQIDDEQEDLAICNSAETRKGRTNCNAVDVDSPTTVDQNPSDLDVLDSFNYQGATKKHSHAEGARIIIVPSDGSNEQHASGRSHRNEQTEKNTPRATDHKSNNASSCSLAGNNGNEKFTGNQSDRLSSTFACATQTRKRSQEAKQDSRPNFSSGNEVNHNSDAVSKTANPTQRGGKINLGNLVKQSDAFGKVKIVFHTPAGTKINSLSLLNQSDVSKLLIPAQRVKKANCQNLPEQGDAVDKIANPTPSGSKLNSQSLIKQNEDVCSVSNPIQHWTVVNSRSLLKKQVDAVDKLEIPTKHGNQANRGSMLEQGDAASKILIPTQSVNKINSQNLFKQKDAVNNFVKSTQGGSKVTLGSLFQHGDAVNKIFSTSQNKTESRRPPLTPTMLYILRECEQELEQCASLGPHFKCKICSALFFKVSDLDRHLQHCSSHHAKVLHTTRSKLQEKNRNIVNVHVPIIKKTDANSSAGNSRVKEAADGLLKLFQSAPFKGKSTVSHAFSRKATHETLGPERSTSAENKLVWQVAHHKPAVINKIQTGQETKPAGRQHVVSKTTDSMHPVNHPDLQIVKEEEPGDSPHVMETGHIDSEPSCGRSEVVSSTISESDLHDHCPPPHKKSRLEGKAPYTILSDCSVSRNDVSGLMQSDEVSPPSVSTACEPPSVVDFSPITCNNNIKLEEVEEADERGQMQVDDEKAPSERDEVAPIVTGQVEAEVICYHCGKIFSDPNKAKLHVTTCAKATS